MAGRRKEPIDLLVAKGKKNLTKAEIEERRNSEIKAPADKVEPPVYLTEKQKTKFIEIAKELIDLEIISNLDCDSLARYIISLDLYIGIYEKLQEALLNGEITAIDKLSKLQDRYFKQCRMAANDLGLTITSRCKLVVPKAPEVPRKNRFDKFGLNQ